jgi:hypothetical protein
MIYNFLYCFFNKFGEDKAPTYGRYVGSLYVAFAILIHALLLLRIIELTTGNSFLDLSDFSAIIKHKRGCLYATMGVWVLSLLYFNTKRTDLLLEKYDKLYEETESNTRLKMMLSLVVPLILFVILVKL